MIDSDTIGLRFSALLPHLDERARRLFAANEARVAGFGGIAAVARVTGVAPSTIGRGLAELALGARLDTGRQRGAGRKPLVETDPGLVDDLLALVEPEARGDPMSPLRWTCKSLRLLAAELNRLGHRISHTLVGELLEQQNFSLQANSKTREGASPHDRDAQFAVLNTAVKTALSEGQPVISVDTKKKEIVGDFKNAGREWRPKGTPEQVRVHDFLIKELGRAVPYGICDLAANAGWISVGMDNDTSAFAVNTIRRWWDEIGRARSRAMRHASSSPRTAAAATARACGCGKVELQRLADEIDLAIEVHHLPPGTSKWNQIEHKVFSFVSMNWRAKPLVSYRVIVNLIAATTTKTGLSVHCELDDAKYPKGIVITDKQMDDLNIERHTFHGEWNDTIKPDHQKIER